MKRRNWVILAALIVIGMVILFLMVNQDEPKDHVSTQKEVAINEVNIDNVKDITLWGEGGVERSADDVEKGEIIRWLNNVEDVRENKGKAGSTPQSGMIIHTKAGDPVLVLRSGDQFEIQQGGKSYWAREPHMRALLDELAGAKK